MYGNMVSVFFYLYALIKAPSTQLYYFFFELFIWK